MANSTVYPYGTGGSLPTSIGLVNDLKTGGMDKALTAEQGKYIGDTIGVYVPIDLTQFTEQNCSLGSSKWYNNGSQKHIAIPVSVGDKYVLKAVNYGGDTSSSNNGWYVFVTDSYSPPYANNGTIPYVGNSVRISLSIGSAENLTVPDTAAYLILTVVDGAGVRVAWSLTKDNTDTQTPILQSIETLNGGISDLDNTIYGLEGNVPFNAGQLTTTAAISRYYAFARRAVSPGDVMTIKLNDYTTYKVGIVVATIPEWTGATIDDTGWKTADITYVSPASGYIRYAIARVDNTDISLAEGEAAISELSLVSHLNGLVDVVDDLVSPPSRIPMDVLGTSTYAGKKVDVSGHSYTHAQVGTLTTIAQARQGFAVFGDYLFQCHNTNASIVVFKLSTATNLQTLTLTADADNHANNAGFGSQYYDAGDPFPLLYISSQAQKKLYAYRITGTEGSFTITLVQTITFNVPYFYANVNIDATNERGIVVGYSQNSWQSATDNKMYCCCFDLPALSEGDVAVSLFYNEFTFPFIYAAQGGVGKYGKLYAAFGNTSAGLNIGGILVIDYILRNVETFIDLNAVGNLEPEGVGLWDDGMVFTTQAGAVYKLTF